MAEKTASEEPKVPLRIQLSGQGIFEGLVPESWVKVLSETPEGAGLKLLLGSGESGKQSDEIKLSLLDTAEQDRLVQQLCFKGVATRVITVGNTIEVEFATKSAKAILELDVLPAGFRAPPGATRRWEVDYETIRILASGIQKFDGRALSVFDPKEKPAEYREEAEKFVMGLPNVIVGYLADEWNRFQGDLRAVLEPKTLGGLVKNS